MKAQDLKNSILQMAMEGKLVPQDPNDEPASALLERIKEEKEQLIKENKIKRNNKESVIFRKNNHFYEKIGKKGEEVCIDDEIPWKIPNTWEWCKLGNLISIITGTSYKKGDVTSDGLRILRGGNIQDNKVFLLDDDIFLPAQNYFDSQKEIKKGDILIVASTGSKKVIGKPGFVNENYENVSIGAFLRICRPLINYLNDYIQIVFGSEYYRNHIRTLAQGTNINNVKKGYLENLFVPLPPLNEQKRIFKKIKELLPFIEDYNVLEDELNKLNEKFPNKIKDSILQDAIQGKLVSQDPNDEPASVLLERIREEKEQLIKENKIKRNKNESFIFKENNHFYEKSGNKETICIDDDIPFHIPNTWEWCRLEQLCNYGQVKSIGSEEISESEWVLDLKDIEKGTGKLLNFTTKKEINSKSKKNCFYKNEVLYCKLRPYLNKVIIAHKNGFCTSEILPLNFGKYILPEYAKLVLMSPYFVDYATKCSYGTKMPRLGTSDGKKALFPLPPLEEQKRIVARLIQLNEKLNI